MTITLPYSSIGLLIELSPVRNFTQKRNPCASFQRIQTFFLRISAAVRLMPFSATCPMMSLLSSTDSCVECSPTPIRHYRTVICIATLVPCWQCFARPEPSSSSSTMQSIIIPQSTAVKLLKAMLPIIA